MTDPRYFTGSTSANAEWAAHLKENAIADIERMEREIAKLEERFGAPITRIDVGVDVLEALQANLPTVMADGSADFQMPLLHGCRVSLNPTLAPDEWAPVYKLRTKR